MIPVLYPANATDYTTNGIGRLSECTYCSVTEERNGVFELELEIPTTAKYFDEIEEERIIVAQPRPGAYGQPFRVYSISKPLNGVVTVYARHISYELNKIVAMPFTASSCAAALVAMKSAAATTCPFDFWTDKVASGTINVKQPTEMRGLLGGQDGSILDVYGTGEYEFDGYTVKLWQNRGIDRGVSIRYGKNLTELNDTTDTSNVYTGIVPFYHSDIATVVLPERVLWGTHKDDYPYGMVKAVDFSSDFETPPKVAQLRAAGQAYINRSTGWQINNNIKVSFVNLADTEEYKSTAALQRVNLCDTVTVVHPALNVEATAKVVKVVYDCINERYTSMELGATRTNLSQAITDEIMEDVPTTSMLQQAIDHANKMITGGLGGYIVMEYNADGQPEELLIMNTPDKATATSVWRWNLGGLGHGSSYATPASDIALTADGKINASMITTGQLNADIIKTGTITGQAQGTTMTIDVDEGVITLGNKSLRVTAGNFKLDANGNVDITGKITATSGKIGDCTIGDGLQYGKTSVNDVRGGMYLGKDGFAVGKRGDYTGFMVTADGTPLSNYLAFCDDAGHRSRYGLWCDAEARIASGGAINVNTEALQTNLMHGTSIIDSYEGAVSDIRLKKNVYSLDASESLAFVMALRPVRYEYNDEIQSQSRFREGVRHGLIAQEVREAIGESADERGVVFRQDDGYFSLRYDDLIGDLIAVAQEQQRRIDALESRLAHVEKLLEGDLK